ncbi:MAG: choice-of-anchor tandem repeat GloVer-containing protein [Verrucomicrobiota bacterium]
MKTSFSSHPGRLLRQVILAFILGIFAAPAARAGLTMEVDLNRGNYQGSQYYQFSCTLSTNSTPPNVSFGDYFVVSPGWPTNANANATLFQYDTNGFNPVSGNGNSFNLFDSTNFSDSFIQNITNGQWSIFVTNTVTTNVYYFTVTASITSNSIPLVTIIYPPNNALNVTNQPNIVWQSATNYSDQELYTPTSGYVLPVTQQSFSGATLSNGLNSITLDTYYLSSTGVVSSVPTNSAGSPLSGWVSTWHVWDYANVQFTVGTPVANFNADLGTTNLPWATMGDTAWFTETTNTYNGAPSADQSGSVTNGQASTLSVVVTGPGTLTFFWSSIANGPGFDYEFDIDGNYADDIAGDTSWYQEFDPNTSLPYNIPAGQHTLTWTVSAGSDTDPTQAGFLDNVSYVAASSPTLTVTASPPSGLAPLAVQFTSPHVDSFGNTVTNWNWDFGDGGISAVQSPLHTYTNAGSYFPSLTAYSTYGSSPLSVTGPGTITVTNPILNVTVTPPSGVAPLTVQFASPGMDSAGDTVTNWNWNFGDGKISSAQNPSHVYTNVGSFSPSLTAYSTYGASPLAVTGLGTINIYTNPFPAFHTLYTFSTNFGSGPNGDLVLLGNTLYGTAEHGGTNNVGIVFAVNTDGTGFTNEYNFSSGSGGVPVGGLISSGNTLYGPTYLGGSLGGGTVFAISTNGLGYTNLLNLNFAVNAASGYEPLAGLALAGNTLYGTTWYGGGMNVQGTLFYVTTNGATSGELQDFYAPTYNPYAINYNGIFPSARLMSSGGTLYGTTEQGGSYGSGTIFSVVTNQPASFSILHYFAAVDPITGTNTEGAYSFSGLVLSGSTLYGTTYGGGTYGNGTVFAVNTNTLVFTDLYNFTGGNDGSGPHAGLTLSGHTLYGTTLAGGTSSNGTLFAINTDGSGFTNLYNFTGSNDGANPQTDLILSGNTLYGTAAGGGSSGNGTIFSFTLPRPLLAITRSGTNAILTWSASPSGYTLEFATNLVSSTVWNTNLPAPVILSGTNTVTNAISTSVRFYRLTQ